MTLLVLEKDRKDHRDYGNHLQRGTTLSGVALAAVDTKQQMMLWGMAQQLSPQQENLVFEALRSGAYQSPNEVIDRALDVLHEQDEWLTANRQGINAKFQRGMEELERGEGIAEDELDAHLQRLKAQAE
jgi:hypothetical protein